MRRERSPPRASRFDSDRDPPAADEDRRPSHRPDREVPAPARLEGGFRDLRDRRRAPSRLPLRCGASGGGRVERAARRGPTGAGSIRGSWEKSSRSRETKARQATYPILMATGGCPSGLRRRRAARPSGAGGNGFHHEERSPPPRGRSRFGSGALRGRRRSRRPVSADRRTGWRRPGGRPGRGRGIRAGLTRHSASRAVSCQRTRGSVSATSSASAILPATAKAMIAARICSGFENCCPSISR